MFVTNWIIEHLQHKQQFFIDTTDAGDQTEDQDCFSQPDMNGFQGVAEPQWRTRNQETSQAKDPLSISIVNTRRE